MAFSIGAYPFVIWRGPPPFLVENRVRRFTRPGVNGVAEQLLGIVGDPFTVELTGHFFSHNHALIALNDWRQLAGLGPLNVVYSGVNYLNFGHRYSVMRVELVRTFTGLLIGTDYVYSNGGAAIARFELQPHA